MNHNCGSFKFKRIFQSSTQDDTVDEKKKKYIKEFERWIAMDPRPFKFKRIFATIRAKRNLDEKKKKNKISKGIRKMNHNCRSSSFEFKRIFQPSAQHLYLDKK